MCSQAIPARGEAGSYGRSGAAAPYSFLYWQASNRLRFCCWSFAICSSITSARFSEGHGPESWTMQHLLGLGLMKTALFDAAPIAAANLRVLLRPTEYWREMGAAEKEIAVANQLAKVREIVQEEPIDVFGNYQMY